ncbi:hypothetical protein HPT27_03140 [Permianibacter sp. IMCC34836]|uniref:hypothetical protein n=1 Tax=Permianibacter fluminis TaxID=2738515 RepID=UPI001554B12F|nr:hypothetical protein [Permianibacter fluminis]NQD36003.1 hypothetical protein [Permianibacter fluminis]
MTVRVDRVWRRDDGGWGWDIKGYEGRGIYVLLATDPGGRGIFVIDGMTSTTGKCVVPQQDFALARDASRRQAVEALEVALTAIGWGPAIRDGENMNKDEASQQREAFELITQPELLQEGTTRQRLLGAELRYDIISSVEHLDYQGVAKRMGLSAECAGEVIAELTAGQEIFSVTVGNVEIFPAYQFDPVHGTPRPEIKQIMASFANGTSAWAIAFWFHAPNGYLSGARPYEHLSVDSSAVVNAARAGNELLDY